MRTYYIYILASKKNGALYVGMTNDLARRIWEHKEELVSGFTKKYKIKKLVYFEEVNDVHDAIFREKCIKRWKREWKIKLIEEVNNNWEDLYSTLL